MATAPPLDGVMAAALDAHRDRCNALVAEARRTRASFDIALLEAQIRGPLAAVVEACEAAAPGRGPDVLAALFGPVVELVGQRRLAGGTHDALFEALPAIPVVVAAAPTRVVGSLANAVVHLRRFAIPVDPWLARVVAASAVSDDPDDVLAAGQVAAWAMGMAHYRDSALDVAATLRPDLLGAALGTTISTTGTSARAAVERLRADRWWRPDRPDADPPVHPTVVHRVGGFRGFGGPFLAPPALEVDRAGDGADALVVRAGDDRWLLHADGFGATLTRTAPDGSAAPPPGGTDLAEAGLAEVTSSGRCRDLLAATIATSYRVLVLDPGGR